MSAPRILVVEDEAVVALDLEERLTALGYAVLGTAASAQAALALAAADRPDLVLMDIRLQGEGDGIDAAHALRHRHGLPVIFLTAYSDEATLARAKVTEPFGYLLKPVEDRELRTVVEMALYRHQADGEIRRLTRLYATLSQVNQALVRARTQEEILREVCRVTVEFGEFPLAWVGIWDRATQAVVPAAHAGGPPGFVEGLRVYGDDRPEGQGPTGTAIRTGTARVVNDYLAVPDTSLGYGRGVLAVQAGFRAGGAFPIRVQGAVWGVLSVYAAEPGVFQAKEVLLFEELVLDISFGLDKLEEEAQRKCAEATLRARSEELDQFFDVTLDLLCIADTDGRFLRLNRAWEATLGFTRAELQRGQFFDFVHPEDILPTQAAVATLAAQREVVSFVNRYRCKDGTYRWLEWRAHPVGSRIYAAARDITERKQAEEDLRAQTRQLEAVRGISMEIARELDLTVLLRLVVERAAQSVEASSGTCFLWEERTQQLVPHAWVGYGETRGEIRLRLGEGIAGVVAQRREGVRTENYPAEAYAVPVNRLGRELRAVMGEPLLYRDRCIGALLLGRGPSERSFTAEDQAFLRLFAAQVATAIENARLHSAAVRHGAQVEALLRSFQSVTSGLDVQAILDRIMAEASRIGATPHVKILLVDEATGGLRVASAMGGTIQADFPIPLAASLSGIVATTGRPLFVPDSQDASQNPNAEFDRRQGLRTYLGLPIQGLRGVLGVLALNTSDPRRYAEEELSALTMLAEQAAIALENARLFQAERRRRRQLEALQAVNDEIARELELPRLLELVRQSVGELLETRCSVVYLWSAAEEVLVPAAWDGERDWLAEVRLRLGEGVAGSAAQRRTGMHVRDYPASPHILPVFRAHTPPGEILAEPMLYRERLLGVLATDNRGRVAGFTPDDQEILRLFASQAAIAIEHARLYEAAQRELAERRQAEAALTLRTRSLEAVRTVGLEITRELELPRLLERMIREAIGLIGARSGAVWLYDPVEQHLAPGAFVGHDPAWFSPIRLRLGEGVTGLVAQRRAGIIVPDLAASGLRTPAFIGRGTPEAVMAEPLLYQDRIVGAIALDRQMADPPFTPQDAETLQLFGAYAAIAVENARLYTAAQQALANVQHAQAEMVRTEQLRGLGQLAAGIAHDLNNTLALVLGQIELAKHADPPPELQELLASIETAASDGAATVKRLQSFARPKGTSPLSPCDLGAIVREVVEMARPRWQAEPQRRGVTMAVALDLPVLPPIQGYAPELREALTNLVFNAVDAMPRGGTLSIAARVTDGQSGDVASGQLGAGAPALPSRRVAESPSRLPGGCVELTIRDTGTGMPPEVQAKIFEPFFTTKGVHGTGLGLSVVYGIIQRHGGSIGVTSAPGQGTTFTLTFRSAPASASGPTQTVAPSIVRVSRQLLVVDDETGVRRTLARLLRLAGHTTLEASDGPSALEVLASAEVDCVLTDLSMPGMSGYALARAVKDARPGLPVILLSGWQDAEPEDQADRQAVDAILGKPIKLPDLLRAIEALGAQDAAAE